MNLRRTVLLSFVAAITSLGTANAAAEPFYLMALDSAKAQLNRLTVSLSTNYAQFPRTVTNGAVTTVPYSDWTSGFFPGCLWLMYSYTGDTTWKTRARTFTNNLQKAATVNDHDVGFRIMCSYGKGLQYQTASQFKLDTAVMMLGARTLASHAYTAAPNTNGNFILMHSTGNEPSNTEIDVPLIYADYYYLEALLRLKNIEEATSAVPLAARSGQGSHEELVSRPYLLSGQGKVGIVIVRQGNGLSVQQCYDIRGRRINADIKIGGDIH